MTGVRGIICSGSYKSIKIISVLVMHWMVGEFFVTFISILCTSCIRNIHSLQNDDDVSDSFIRLFGRPPSGQTLQDDTWMFAGAGSKASGY